MPGAIRKAAPPAQNEGVQDQSALDKLSRSYDRLLSEEKGHASSFEPSRSAAPDGNGRIRNNDRLPAPPAAAARNSKQRRYATFSCKRGRDTRMRGSTRPNRRTLFHRRKTQPLRYSLGSLGSFNETLVPPAPSVSRFSHRRPFL